MRHYLEFTDGLCIEAYPKANKDKNRERSDTSDQSLDLFLRNAHRLIAEGDRIMADSRMFLTPVPIKCGLAYTGTSGFNNPTLGIYIEWWRGNRCAWTEDERGVLQPIYYIAGSPLSGRNSCAYVCPDGTSCSVSVSHFSSVWSTFAKINSHYTEAKELYEAYTLTEVIALLPNPEINKYG